MQGKQEVPAESWLNLIKMLGKGVEGDAVAGMKRLEAAIQPRRAN